MIKSWQQTVSKEKRYKDRKTLYRVRHMVWKSANLVTQISQNFLLGWFFKYSNASGQKFIFDQRFN